MAKNRYLAAFLSFILAGFGQFYVGSYLKGAVFLVFDLLSSYLYMNDVLPTAALVLNLVVTVVSMVDAYRTAGMVKAEGKSVPSDETPINVRAY